MVRRGRWGAWGMLLAGIAACNAEPASVPADCVGDIGCECEADGDCLNGLSCLSNLCVEERGTGGENSSTGGAKSAGSQSGGGSGATTGGTGGGGGTGGTGGIDGTGGSGGESGGADGSGGGGGTGGAGGSGGSGGTGGSGGSGGQNTVGAGGATTTSSMGGAATMNTSGSNTSAGCMGSGITAAEPLVPVDGWVSCSSNAAGVEGEFFTFSDEVESTIMPTTFTGSEICVSGTVGQLDAGTYMVWGAGVGFNFKDGSAWNATAAGASGVSFNITALPAGPETLVIFTTTAGSYCAVLASAGAQTVKFADTSLDCWDPGGAAPTETGIISVQWQVMSNAESAHSFDFCIEDLAVVP